MTLIADMADINMTNHTANGMVNYWIVDKDGILCDEFGTPACLSSAWHTQAIRLDLTVADDGIDDRKAFPQFVLSKENALALKLIAPYGDKYDSPQQKSLDFLAYRDIVGQLSIAQAQLASCAIELILWQQSHRFCSRCGTPTHSPKCRHPNENAIVCPKCRHRAYPRVQPCVIVAITRTHPKSQKRQILLALHHRHQHTGMYGLIAGFVEAGESLTNAVHREVAEEVGIRIDNIRYFDSQPWPYPSNLMLGFVADYQDGDIRPEPHELADARFFDIDDLPTIPQVGTIAHALIHHVCTA